MISATETRVIEGAPSMRSWPRRALLRLVERVKARGQQALARALRLTGASVGAYTVALGLSTSEQPLLAPLTAILVVQLTLFSTLKNGWERVVSVVAGVAVAVVFSALTALTWWSLALVIGLSIVLGQLLRLGDYLLEVPISAMLVLAVGQAESAALGRIFETVIGAAVGVLANVIFPPPLQQRDAGLQIERFGAEIAALLDRAADALTHGADVTDASRWMVDARRLSRHVGRIDGALLEAEESRRLNVRALGTADPGPSLRRALDALEHTTVAVRSMFRSILDGLSTRPEVVDDEEGVDLRDAFALLLHDVAAAVRDFARMVRHESRAAVDGDSASEAAGDESQLVSSLEALREARARVTELLLVDPRRDQQLWELNSSLLSTVERVLRELDVDEHVRARERRRREALDRGLPAAAAQRLRTTTRHLADRTRFGRMGH